MVGPTPASGAELLDALPSWVRLVRAPNPGPMTLDGTNSWVLWVPGADRSLVVDPGPLAEDHLAALAGHAPVGSILVTHGHPDHVEGAARLAHLAGGVPVLAAYGPYREIDRDREIDREIDVDFDLDVHRYGLSSVRVLATPGHTSDSVCFLVEADGQRVILTGDTILGRGTTVVAHPDGGLGDYLASLRRLERLGSVPVLPGHGPALADCAAAAQLYLDHRLARLEQVREARAGGARTAAEVVARVYADVDRALWWAAELSVQAQLAYLAAAADAQADPASDPAADAHGRDANARRTHGRSTRGCDADNIDVDSDNLGRGPESAGASAQLDPP